MIRTLLAAITGALILSAPALAHHNTITAAADCQDDGTYLVTWSVENSEWQTDHATETITASNRAVVPVGTSFSTQYLVAGETVAGSTTALTLTLSAQWSNGVTHTDSGSATGFEEGCQAPPAPPAPPVASPPAPPAAKYAPRASVQGPCGDPMYRAVFDNRRSNRSVTFRFTFRQYRGAMVTYTRTVLAGRLVKTRYVHVRGYGLMKITARGHVLLRKHSAAPGEYAPCKP